MKIPFSYVFRNLWARKVTTLLTASGMALVVFVFAAVLMLDAGLKRTLVSTGSLDNAILLRQSSQTEIQSAVYRDQASLIETFPEVARGLGGEPLVSKETLVLTQIAKRGSDRPQNVVVRGLSPMGVQLRPQVRIVDGRMFRPGTSEISSATASPTASRAWASASGSASPGASGRSSAPSTAGSRDSIRRCGETSSR
jgi:ABC-type transport system, involved in lipoprotein release, permease component